MYFRITGWKSYPSVRLRNKPCRQSSARFVPKSEGGYPWNVLGKQFNDISCNLAPHTRESAQQMTPTGVAAPKRETKDVLSPLVSRHCRVQRSAARNVSLSFEIRLKRSGKITQAERMVLVF